MTNKMRYVYDPVDLIELIKQRPCIWNKSIRDYKNRIKKGQAWEEIYKFLIDDFERLEEKKKLAAGKSVNEKWKHIRDAFALSIKKTSEEDVQENEENQLCIIVKEETSVQSLSSSEEPGSSDSSAWKRMRSCSPDDINKTTLKALKTAHLSPPDMDEDTAFFKSLVPTVNKFSEDEKLEFRMGVLTLIKGIKQKRISPLNISSKTS
ncbi:hypothetical protein Trydic_g22729 [Trypoxylus dichotomus]